MTSQNNEATELRDPNNPILDQYGLAALLGISPKSIPAKRSRTPNELPPPFFRRPLRWRREGVLEWMKQQEAIAQGRAERLAAPPHSVSKPLRRTTPVRRVCAISGTLRGHGMRTRLRRGSKRKLLAKREFDSGPTTSAMPQLLDKIYTLDSRPRRQHATTGGRRHG